MREVNAKNAKRAEARKEEPFAKTFPPLRSLRLRLSPF